MPFVVLQELPISIASGIMAIPDQFRGVPNECLIYSLEQVQLKNVFHQQLLRAVNQTRIWYELKIQLIWSGPLLVVMIEGPVHKP